MGPLIEIARKHLQRTVDGLPYALAGFGARRRASDAARQRMAVISRVLPVCGATARHAVTHVTSLCRRNLSPIGSSTVAAVSHHRRIQASRRWLRSRKAPAFAYGLLAVMHHSGTGAALARRMNTFQWAAASILAVGVRRFDARGYAIAQSRPGDSNPPPQSASTTLPVASASASGSRPPWGEQPVLVPGARNVTQPNRPMIIIGVTSFAAAWVLTLGETLAASISGVPMSTVRGAVGAWASTRWQSFRWRDPGSRSARSLSERPRQRSSSRMG